MIIVRVKVPSNLAGGTLVQAHKWVKSQMVRGNPGGTADYTLRGVNGHSLTLSDLVRSNPGHEIEVEIISGHSVRSNPGTTIPTGFDSFADFPRHGNYATQLLPANVSPAMVDRMVAEEGVFGAVQTLTILLSERSAVESMSPAVAGLVYSYSAVPRQNPSVKTPFLGDDVKGVYDAEMRIRQYLDQHGIEDISHQSTILGEAKVSAEYGMTKRDLDKFAQEVLAPFMVVAAANRGVLRVLNRKLSAKTDKASMAKLMHLLPTKAEDFYNGREYALMAPPQCIFPIYSERVVTPKAAKALLSFAKKFPANVTHKGLKMSGSQHDVIRYRKSKPRWWRNPIRWVTYSILPENLPESARRKVISGESDYLIKDIINTVNRPGAGEAKQPFVFMPNLGGFYPSPPKRWPQEVVYAVMDVMLESLPDIVDVDDPTKNYRSKVYHALSADKIKDTDEFYLNHKDVVKFSEIKAAARGGNADRKAILDKIDTIPSMQKSALENSGEQFLVTILSTVVSAKKGFTLNTNYGKSVLEMLIEVNETAMEKYNYEMTDNDHTFAMVLLDYSTRELFDASKSTPDSLSLGGIIGSKQVDSMLTKAQKLIDATPDVRGKASTSVVIRLTALNAYLNDQYNMAQGGNKPAALTNLDQMKTSIENSGIPKNIMDSELQLVADEKKRVEALP